MPPRNSNSMILKILADSSQATYSLKQVKEALGQVDTATAKSNTAFTRMHATFAQTAKHAVGLATAFVGVGGVIEGLEGSIKAAQGAELAHTLLGKALQTAGSSFQQTGGEIDAFLRKESELAAYSKEELSQSLATLVRSSGSVTAGMRDVAIATDVARAKNIDLATATKYIQSIEAGRFRSLVTLGIQVPKVTAAQDALRASGEKYTKSQLDQAKAQDLDATRTEALRRVQERYAGDAAAFGNTSAGAYAKFHAAVHELEVEVGTALLPALTKLVNELTPMINKFVDSGHAAKDVKEVLDALETAAALLKTGIDAVDKVTGGFKNTLELLIGLKIASTVSGWVGNFANLIGGPSSGLKGAAAEAESWKGKLLSLQTLGPIAITLAVTELINQKQQSDALHKMGAIPVLGSTLQGHSVGDPAFPFNGQVGTLQKINGQIYFVPSKGQGKVTNSPNPADYQRMYGAAGSGNAYPLGAEGKVIGTPFQGTHAKAFNVAGGSDNWESENAVDIAVKVGTPVLAVENGYIGPASEFGSLGSGGRFAGLRLHLICDSGNEYYYAHLSRIIVKPNQRVKKGQQLGMSGSANGVAHLHFAEKSGNPMSFTGLPVPKPVSSGGGGGAGPPAPTGAGSLSQAGAQSRLNNFDFLLTKAHATGGNERAVLQEEKSWINSLLAEAKAGTLKLQPGVLKLLYTALGATQDQLDAMDKASAKTKKKHQDNIDKLLAQLYAEDKRLGNDPEWKYALDARSAALNKMYESQLATARAGDAKLLKQQRAAAKEKLREQQADDAFEQQQAQQALDAWEQAQSAAQTAFEDAFNKVSDKVMTVFDRQTQAGLDAIQKKYAQMQSALEAQFNAPTPAEQALKNLEDAHNAAAEQSDLSAAQTALQKALAIGDPAAIKQAQQQIDDIQYQMQVDALQKQADAERAAADKELQDKEDALQQQEALEEQNYQDMRDNQRQALADWLTDQETMLEQGKEPWSQFWGALITKAGLAGSAVSAAFWAGLSGDASGAAGALQTFQNSGGGGGGDDGGGDAVHQPGVQLATGGIVMSPTVATVGERGPEAVIPLDRWTRGLGMTGPLHIHFDGPVYTDDRGIRELTTKIRRELYRTQSRNNGLGFQ